MIKSHESSHRQILRSSSIIGGASVINILISLVRIKVVAVLLGPAGVGLVGLLQNLMGTASTVSSLGVGNVGTRQIAEATGRDDQIGIDATRRALFWGTLVLAAVGGLGFWVIRRPLAQWLMNDSTQADMIGWLAVGVALTVAGSAQSALLTGMRRIGDIARAQIISSVLSTALGIGALVWFGQNGLLAYILVIPLIGFIVTHIYVARLPAVQSPRTPVPMLISQWKILISLGFAFMLASLVSMLGQLAVRTIVQDQLGADALGYFHAAFTISMTYLGFVLGAMGTDYYPRLTASIHDHETTNRLVNEQTEVALLLAGPVFLAMLTLAPWVIQLLYSAEFAPAVSVLRWQVLGDIFKVASWPLGFIILASGDGKKFLITESFAMTIFVCITWLMIPMVGIQATGVSFLAMHLLYLPVVYILANKKTGFSWSKSVKRDLSLLAAGAVMVSAAGHWNKWLGALVGLIVLVVVSFQAIVRLSNIVEIGGKPGVLAEKCKGLLCKFGLYRHDEKKSGANT